jgi:uncharacterized membrane protein
MPLSGLHYFPLALPFIIALFFVIAFLVVSVEIGILKYAYEKIGVDHRYIFTLLLLSLVGSYINIPVAQLPAEPIVHEREMYFFGVRHMIPLVEGTTGTVIAVNLGGAVVPTLLSIYLVMKNRLYARAAVGTAIVTVVMHALAHPVRGVGIALPIFIPPLVAAAVALVISRQSAPVLAYVCGSMGTLIGADLLNLDKIPGLGAPVASIGGAGTFDGIFLTGILAVLLA